MIIFFINGTLNNNEGSGLVISLMSPVLVGHNVCIKSGNSAISSMYAG